jgi:quercetin dioxygenase-like cupin family protein
MDIVTVTSGHLRLQLDSGEVVDLYSGDHVIQRGTMHKWSNPSETEPTRFVAVIVPIEEFKIADGKGGTKVVSEEHVKGSERADFQVSKL